MALLVLADLAMRAFDLTDHYTDLGALPRESLLGTETGRMLPYLSLHFLGGSVAWQSTLFAIAALAAIAMAVGYRARASTFVVWLLLVSLQNRNPVITYGGDIFLVLMVFWAMFLPTGARFSVDAARRAKSPDEPTQVWSMGSAALLIQLAAIYFFSALHKSGDEWLPDGTAIYYALHIDQLALPLAHWIREFDLPLRLLTFGTYALEIGMPVLLFCPIAFVPLRMLAILGIVALHTGLILTLSLLLFNWIGALSILVALPAWFWDELLPRLTRRAAPAPAGSADDSRPPLSGSIPASIVAALSLVFVLVWNVSTLRDKLPSSLETQPALRLAASAGLALRLGQRWEMFSPRPPRQSEWFIVVGRLGDGQRVDLMRDRVGAPSFEKPAHRSDYHLSARWERYFTYADDNDYVDGFETLLDYYCRRWNDRESGGRRLVAVRVFKRREYNRVDRTRDTNKPKLVYTARCDGADAEAVR